jgi:hypothetical protein
MQGAQLGGQAAVDQLNQRAAGVLGQLDGDGGGAGRDRDGAGNPPEIGKIFPRSTGSTRTVAPDCAASVAKRSWPRYVQGLWGAK